MPAVDGSVDRTVFSSASLDSPELARMSTLSALFQTLNGVLQELNPFSNPIAELSTAIVRMVSD